MSALRTYTVTYLSLMLLLLLTVFLSFVDIPHMNLLVALTVASVKMVLVLLFFMHLKASAPLAGIFMAAAGIMLAIAAVVTWVDYATRF